MPKHAVRGSDGSYTIYSDSEYRSRNGGGGCLFFVGLFAIGLYGLVWNILNFEVYRQFGWSLYVNNIKSFGGSSLCVYMQDYPLRRTITGDTPSFDGMRIRDKYGTFRKPLPLFSKPVEIKSAPNRKVEAHILTEYHDQAIIDLQFPFVARHWGSISYDVPWQQDYSTGESEVVWSAVTIKTANGSLKGYIPYDLREEASYKYVIDRRVKAHQLSGDFIKQNGIDIKKLKGNRFEGRFNDVCDFEITEIGADE